MNWQAQLDCYYNFTLLFIENSNKLGIPGHLEREEIASEPLVAKQETANTLKLNDYKKDCIFKIDKDRINFYNRYQ